ncbi:MAG: hypothetical protein H7A18_02675 [Sinobacteraceae bacterium]|nr:hypothetical protein [Nevskiaceae bacterium]MCP5470974.1 hypothetical protein [Nevskiaceae bacterium]
MSTHRLLRLPVAGSLQRAVVAATAVLTIAAAAAPLQAQSSAPTRTDTAGLAGYGGMRWSTDYGIGAGRCDRESIVLDNSNAPRTLVQRHEENLQNRSVGIIGASSGSGVLLGTRLGGRLDQRDRHCLGHVLELGAVGREVSWTNPTTRQSHIVVVSEYTPTRSTPTGAGHAAKDRCRVLLLTTVAAGVAVRGPAQRLVACQANPGVWSIR